MTNNTIKRPIGISIISGVYIISSLIQGIIVTFMYSYVGDMSTFQTVIVYLELIAILMIGFGLSFGKKWGWWAMSILLSSSVIYGVYEVINLKSLLSEMNLNEYGFKKEAYMSFGQTFLQLLMLIYLFQKNVFAYFGCEYATFSKKLIKVLIIGAILFSISYVLG